MMPRPLTLILLLSAGLAFAARAALPTDDPALAEDLKAYIASLDPAKPADCIGFVNRHLSDILYRRFTPESALECELARMKSAHSTACLKNHTLKGLSKEEILRLEAAERASPWWERSGWSTREKQSLLRRPPEASNMNAKGKNVKGEDAKEQSAGKNLKDEDVPASDCDRRPGASASDDFSAEAGWCDLAEPRSQP